MDHLCLSFQETATLLSKVIIPFTFHTAVYESSASTSLTNTWYGLAFYF